MIWTREQAKALTDRALSFSKAEETQVVLTGGDRANVRFARNSVTTSGASSGYSLAIVGQVRPEDRHGDRVGVQRREPAARARNAEEIARLSPDNPEAMPLLGAQTYAPIKSYFEDAAGGDAGVARRRGARRARRGEGEERRLRGLRRDVGADPGGRDVEGTVRLRPLHRGRLQPDGAHAGRHRLGLGVEVVQRAAPARSEGARVDGDRQGGALAQSDRDRARQIHRRPRAGRAWPI